VIPRELYDIQAQLVRVESLNYFVILPVLVGGQINGVQLDRIWNEVMMAFLSYTVIISCDNCRSPLHFHLIYYTNIDDTTNCSCTREPAKSDKQ